MPDIFFFIEWLYYVTGFWLFLGSPRFRRATIRRWRERKGIEHAATTFEIVISLFCGALTALLAFEMGRRLFDVVGGAA